MTYTRLTLIRVEAYQAASRRSARPLRTPLDSSRPIHTTTLLRAIPALC